MGGRGAEPRNGEDIDTGWKSPCRSSILAGMRVGDVVADRFVIQRPIGSGGMGSVFRAADRVSGEAVALKILDLVTEDAARRFRREARLLSELSHPGIVRHVAHGETADGRPFLAMELLEGEDLSERLARGSLVAEESLELFRAMTGALACAHARGIVHRDLKPSNLFLVDRAVGNVKVLDFGIARAFLETQGLTQSGAFLGTVGYMAPEQATGAADVDARADVFALGCILFECLTGTPAFSGAHAVAILAKVLADEPPKVSDLVPETAAALDVLVAKLLAKRPEDRAADAGAVLTLLDSPELVAAETGTRRAVARPPSLTHSERQLATVVLAEPRQVQREGTLEAEHAQLARVHDLAAHFGAELRPLRGGGFLFVVTGGSAASDQAARGALLALSLHGDIPELLVTLSIGRAATTARLPVGAAIDRAALLLRDAKGSGIVGVRVDAMTAALLGSRFDVRDGILLGEAVDLGAPRHLLGKPTPTVGRDKELGLLDATLAECIADCVARVVLVTAPPGFGKSRLATEFMARARRDEGLRLLFARADAVAGEPLVQSLVRIAIGVGKGTPTPALRERLGAYVRSIQPEAEARRTTEFLEEALGIAGEGKPSPELVTARNDPRIMRLRLREAVISWLLAETAVKPVVIVLEDLQWADSASVAHLEAALPLLANRPVMLVAFGRPEAAERWSRIGDRADAQEIRLGPLTRKAAERLVAATLGEGGSRERADRIVERAAGNAFYLEELIRHAADGADDLPETVTMMASARIERLEPEARRILRAASIFGDAFSVDGVAALLGSPAATSTWLETLARREVLDRAHERGVLGDSDYVFRHAFLREAAYGMLTDEDCRAGHVMAGDWLSRQDRRDPLVIAEHFVLAGASERASPWLARGIARSFGHGFKPEHTQALIDRALAAVVVGPERGIVRAYQAVLAVLRGDLGTMIEAGQGAVQSLPVTTPEWFWASTAVAIAAMAMHEPALVAGIMEAVLAADSPLPATGPVGWTLQLLVHGACSFQTADVVPRLLEIFAASADRARQNDGPSDPAFIGNWAVARSVAHAAAFDDVAASLQAAREAGAHSESAAGVQGTPNGIYCLGNALLEAGDLQGAVRELDRAIRVCRSVRNEILLAFAVVARGAALTESGMKEGADALLGLVNSQPEHLRGFAQVSLAAYFLRAGEPDRASDCLPPVAAMSKNTAGYYRRALLAMSASVLLAQGAAVEALEVAERAASDQARLTMRPLDRSRVLLVHAECLDSVGRRAEAGDVIRGACERLLRSASRFDDPALRSSYLTALEANRRTLALAREWEVRQGGEE